MPKTKVTQRKPGFLCSICLVRLPTKDKWSEHLLKCGMADIQKRRFECNFCDHAFGRKIVLVKHRERLHPGQDHCITPLESTEPEKSPQDAWKMKRIGRRIQENCCLRRRRRAEKPVERTGRRRLQLPGVKRRNTETSETVTIDLPSNEEKQTDTNLKAGKSHQKIMSHQKISERW